MVRQVQRSKISISKLSISFFLGPILLFLGDALPAAADMVRQVGRYKISISKLSISFFWVNSLLFLGEALPASAEMVRQVERNKISISKLSLSFFLGQILICFWVMHSPQQQTWCDKSGKVQGGEGP